MKNGEPTREDLANKLAEVERRHADELEAVAKWLAACPARRLSYDEACTHPDHYVPRAVEVPKRSRVAPRGEREAVVFYWTMHVNQLCEAIEADKLQRPFHMYPPAEVVDVDAWIAIVAPLLLKRGARLHLIMQPAHDGSDRVITLAIRIDGVSEGARPLEVPT